MQDGGQEKYFLHNHLRFNVLFNINPETDTSRIVGFEVEPFSVRHQYEGTLDTANPHLLTCAPASMRHVKHDDEPQAIQEGDEVVFTYDVLWTVRATRSSFPALVVGAALWRRWWLCLPWRWVIVGGHAAVLVLPAA